MQKKSMQESTEPEMQLKKTQTTYLTKLALRQMMYTVLWIAYLRLNLRPRCEP